MKNNDFDKHFNETSNMIKRTQKLVFLGACLSLAVGSAFMAFMAWAIYRVVTALT